MHSRSQPRKKHLSSFESTGVALDQLCASVNWQTTQPRSAERYPGRLERASCPVSGCPRLSRGVSLQLHFPEREQSRESHGAPASQLVHRARLAALPGRARRALQCRLGAHPHPAQDRQQGAHRGRGLQSPGQCPLRPRRAPPGVRPRGHTR